MLPYGRQTIDDDDIAAVVEVLRDDLLTTGPKVEQFERALCDVTGANYAVACSNGTTALHLASLTLGLTKGDCVIVPAITFLATANAARYCEADVVFSDVNPETGLMEVKHLEEAISRCSAGNLKAVFPVHLTGQCVNLKAVSDVAQRHNLTVVADSCHALGGICNDRAVGACEHEDLSTFSFHPVKTIAMGEGGAVTTNIKEYADKMRLLRSHSMQKTDSLAPWFYEMPDLGYNYRLTDIQCALGISQLKKLKDFVARRKVLVNLYDDLLAPLFPFVKPPQKSTYCDAAWHLYAVRVDFSALNISRTELMKKLAQSGIGTQVHYIPVNTQPYYKKLYGNIVLDGANQYYKSTLSLPLYPTMREDDVVYVVDKMKDILGS